MFKAVKDIRRRVVETVLGTIIHNTITPTIPTTTTTTTTTNNNNIILYSID